MGMYWCRDTIIAKEHAEWCERFQHDWNGWVSVYEWPFPRKNKELPFHCKEQPYAWTILKKVSIDEET